MKRVKRNEAILIIAINLSLVIVLVAGLETTFRYIGIKTINEMESSKPAWASIYKDICQKALKENLIVFNAFYTDSEGIFKANPEFDFNSLEDYRGVSINSNGFRGNEFKHVESDNTRLLLIGDSFTWGLTAVPISHSFADLIQSAGYYIYNAGIPGTDPLQYAKVAAKYISLIKPDIVAVCLFLGNDFRPCPHPVIPNRNLYYLTNLGWIRGYDDGREYFKNAVEAFEYLNKKKCGRCDNIIDYLMYKTVVGGVLYNGLHKASHLKSSKNPDWVIDSLNEIKKISEINKSEFLIFLIPILLRNKGNCSCHLRKGLRFPIDLKYYCPGNFTSSDYCSPPDGHFNNMGHRKFADFMIGVLKAMGYMPKMEAFIHDSVDKP